MVPWALADVDCVVMRLVRTVRALDEQGYDHLLHCEFGGRGWGMGDAQEPGVTASPGMEPPADQAAVILTPDQRVRVFISSTLQELAEERAAARRAIRRLHLVPVWYESGARPHLSARSLAWCAMQARCPFPAVRARRYRVVSRPGGRNGC